jgi:uncharacterized hydrophobic protein (TIGR00271 family)
MENFLHHFKIFDEKEDYDNVVTNINASVTFQGTNLWILIFAIFVASLGLNVNSTAVIIGAMLISPLMGPIMGLGLGMGINDLDLLRRSITNYLFASLVGLITSTVYFAASPINDAHSEILARTSPTIYDVLIAFFGGLAGILATSSKQKGNVIPGVAIATALMPPLCTAGFGLATLQFNFLFGALYLYLINTVFIALATLVTVRWLHFPFKHLPDQQAELKAKKIVIGVVILTLLPSIYFGYDIVQQSRFTRNAERFIETETNFPNDYLLNQKIDPKKKKINLTYGGKGITKDEIDLLQAKLKNHNLDNAMLEVRQGFAYLSETTSENEKVTKLNNALAAKEREVLSLRSRLDSISHQSLISKQIYAELKAQQPEIYSAVIQPSEMLHDTLSIPLPTTMVILHAQKDIPLANIQKLENWLKVRLDQEHIKLIIQK